jgi:uncharacterized membrane protein
MSRRWARPTRITWWAAAFAVLTTAGTAGYLAANYSSLPHGVPVRYEHGLPAIFQMKTPLMVALPAIVQLGLLAVFGAVVMLLLWRARPPALPALSDSDFDGVEGSDSDLQGVEGADTAGIPDGDGARMRLAAEGIALLAAVWVAVQAFGAVRLVVLWRLDATSYGEAYWLMLATAIVASTVIGARTMKLVGDRRPPTQPVDPAMWRLTSLYFNPGDPALFVPTRTGAGWTLNFGRPMAIVLLVGTLIAGIGGPYVLARYVLRGFGS